MRCGAESSREMEVRSLSLSLRAVSISCSIGILGLGDYLSLRRGGAL